MDGGAYGQGTAFEIVNTGTPAAPIYASTPKTLVSFINSDGYVNGAGISGLITDAKGDLFGTTELGGANGYGTVFEIAKTASGYASTPITLVSFNNFNADPLSGLIIDAKGDLFGMTFEGGANGVDGTVFEIAKTASGYASTPTILVNFNGTNGALPYGGHLIADANGNLFGATLEGGTNGGYGTVFEITDSGFVVTRPPSIMPDRAHVRENQKVTADAAHGVLANDIDPVPNDTLSVSAVDGQPINVGHAVTGSYGTLTLKADGSYSYLATHELLPLPSGVGIDTFSYTAAERAGGTATSTLTVVVTSPGQTYVGRTSGTKIQGGFGLYVLDGGAGNDTLVAGTGIQTLIGGPNDTLKAGLGIDTFVFAPNHGQNTITNFNPLLDSIQLPKSEFATFAAVHMANDGHGNTVITYDTHDTITLTGVSLSSLHAFNFHFV